MRWRLLVPLLLSACTATGSSSRGIERARGPYLQQPRADGVLVVWDTADPTPNQLRWGRAADRLDQTAGDGSQALHHEVRIEGLLPGDRAFYEVADVGAGTFRTAPAPSEPILVMVLGDTGDGSRRQLSVRDALRTQLAGRRPDLFLHLGDLAYPDGTATQLQRYFFEIYAAELRDTPVWPALGNHDVRSVENGRGPFFDAFVLPAGGEEGGVPSGTEAFYSFDYGPAHFVVLDSTHEIGPADPMLDWLRRDLGAAAGARWQIAVLHHPPYSKGTHDSDTERRLIEVREQVVPILEAGGVDLVLAGHSHDYERSALVRGAYETPTEKDDHVLDGESPYQIFDGGTVYVVAGHGGFPARNVGPLNHPLMVFSENAHGGLLLEIDPAQIRGANVRSDGVVSDAWVLVGPAAQ